MFLQKNKDQQSSHIQLSAPPSPYTKQAHPTLDELWWNPKTKNSLSYFSNCSKNTLSLKEIEQGTLADLESYRIIKTDKAKTYRYSVIKINYSDGTHTRSGIYTLKDKNCFYILNFVANSAQSFKTDLPIFLKFIKDFKPK